VTDLILFDEYNRHARVSQFLQHPVFNMYHSETEMLRYLYTLQSRDLSLATAMIPLGILHSVSPEMVEFIILLEVSLVDCNRLMYYEIERHIRNDPSHMARSRSYPSICTN
jgi:hypothetical protein